jgi:hypothetical protein
MEPIKTLVAARVPILAPRRREGWATGATLSADCLVRGCRANKDAKDSATLRTSARRLVKIEIAVEHFLIEE